MQNDDLAGKTLVVTGGGGDIGLATAKMIAGHGAKVALVDLRQDAVEAAAESVKAVGAEARSYACDVSDEKAVGEVIGQIRADFGTIDLLFNNAGYQGDFTPVHHYSVNDFRKVIDINLTGAFIVLHAVAQVMVEAEYGSIVNMASRAGTFGPPNMAAYAASKAGLIGLTKTASRDLAPYGIRVNSVGPALLGPGTMWERQVEKQAAAGSQYFPEDPREVEKQMIRGVPMRRLGSHDEVAAVVEFLLSDRSSYVSGSHITIGGGLD